MSLSDAHVRVFVCNTVIPLAKKLGVCGVFGVSSDEFLNYALINRKEWEKKGREMVARYLEKYDEEFGMYREAEDQDHTECTLSDAVELLDA